MPVWRVLRPILSLAAVMLPALVAAQPPGPVIRALGDADATDSEAATRLSVAGRREIRLYRTAIEHLEAGRPAEAIVYLQTILGADADGFIEEAGRLVSLRAAAGRRLDGLTGEAREAYDLRYGPAAKGLLDEALKAGDEDALSDVARRFPATDAGREAAFRLTVASLDRGEPLAAAARFEHLRATVSADRKRDLLARLTACYDRLGDLARRDAVLKELASIGGDLRFGDRSLAASDTEAVRSLLSTRPAARGGTPADPQRFEWTAVALADPFLKPGVPDSALSTVLHRWTAQTGLGELAAGRPGVTVSRPVVAGGALIVRTPANVTAFDLATGAARWRTLADPLCWDYLNGTDYETPDGDAAGRTFVAQRLWADATWGALATDGRLVFAVEETGVSTPLPPPPGTRFREAAPQAILPPAFNRLAAYDVATGGRIWEAGGPPDGRAPLAGAFFLGPPVPAGGRWYALADLGGTTPLVALDPERPDAPLWSQPVAEHDRPIDRDPGRRTAGLRPVVAGGLFVCPVGPGTVVTVDPATRSLLWGYTDEGSKRETKAEPVPVPLPIRGPFVAAETDPPPAEVVAAGSVVLVASRAGTVVGLDPLDGTTWWKTRLLGHLWMIGTDEATAYAQTGTGVVAVRLRDGTPAWPAPAATGPPSGRGMIADGRLYVPLADATLAVLDAANGRSLASLPAPNDQPFGNLTLVGRTLVSQSATQVTAIPLP